MDEQPRVLIVGIDGATFDLLKPMAARGLLPTFDRLLQEGSHGVLRSTLPYESPPAWATFATGKNPGRHGIFGFQQKSGKAYEPVLTSGCGRMRAPFWEFAGKKGRRVGVINVLGTYPVREVNGFLIGGPESPAAARYTWPDELREDIEENVGPYIVDAEFPHLEKKRASEFKYLENILQAMERRWETARYLWEKHDPECYTVVFTFPDRVQTFFWHCIDPAAEEGGGDEELRRRIEAIYARMDGILGEIVGRLDERWRLVIMSDHGFGPSSKEVNLNRWLFDRGYLAIKGGGGSPEEQVRAKERLMGLKTFARSMVPSPLWSMMKKVRPPGLTDDALGPWGIVDWEKTTAYAMGVFQNVHLNVKGREPRGKVEPADYERIRSGIMKELRTLSDPGDGDILLKGVYGREEFYGGPYLDLAPDILFDWQRGYRPLKGFDLVQDFVVTSGESRRYHFEMTGWHERDGVLLCRGPGIRRGAMIPPGDIVDVAPTVLYMLGLPVPASMDGRLVTELFEEKFLEDNPVRYEEAEEEEAGLAGEEGGYSAEEQQEIEKRLRSLGYLE